MSDKNKIVCLSTTNFHPLPTRKQNVMTRLQNSEILYFDPPVSLLAPIKDRKLLDRVFAYRKGGQRVHENITAYAMPPVLPFFNKYRWINKVNQLFAGIYVDKIMKKHGFTHRSLLWCYSPSSCDILPHVEYNRLVYDCVDRHSAYKGMINPQVVDKMEADLAKKCDTVFSTAVGLHETLSEYNSSATMIPNGAAYEIFSLVNEREYARPVKLEGRTGPVFGFVGMLQECIDYDLIESLAKNRPDATIMLVGKTLPGVNVDHLRTYPNIIFQGLVPQKDLPAIISHFDVCLNVFRSGTLSKDVSPLKFYEYLATGKPIVSTREPLQVSDFEDVVYIAGDEAEFLEMCDRAVKENDPEIVKRRMTHGKLCSWDSRVSQMEKILCDKNIMRI